jgi:hypothetical protein
VAEPARAPLRRLEVVHDFETGVDHRNEDHLGDPFAGLHGERRIPAIPAGNEHLPLVVGVDQPDEVAEDDAVLVAESGARQQHGREGWVADVDRHAGGYQHGLAGRHVGRCFDAGPHIDPRRALGRVLGQREFGTQPRIEDLELDDLHPD